MAVECTISAKSKQNVTRNPLTSIASMSWSCHGINSYTFFKCV